MGHATRGVRSGGGDGDAGALDASLLLLQRASSATEQRLIRDWARCRYPGAPIIDWEDPGLGARLAQAGDPDRIEVNIDPAAISDTERFGRCLAEGLSEILALHPAPPNLCGVSDRPVMDRLTNQRSPVTPTEFALTGTRETIQSYGWSTPEPRYLVVLAHGYGEHARRYDHVAGALVSDGAAVFALDHHGHGRSGGERASVSDPQDFIEDLDTLLEHARGKHPGLEVMLIGHSMGGLIAARYVQQHQDKITALVLSGPVIGGNPAFEQLLAMDPIPDVPIDPAILSRDPSVGEAYVADPLVYHGPFRRETLQALFTAVEDVAAGPRIEIPTLWIHGELDMLAPLDVTRSAAAAIRTDVWQEKVYPGSMHEIFNEINQAEVITDVIEFVNGALAVRT